MGLLLTLVSSLHLILVLFAAAVPLYTLWLEWHGTRRNDLVADQLGRSLAIGAIWSLVAGAALGGFALLLLWAAGDTPYFQGFSIIPLRRLWFSVAELVVYLLGMIAYVVWWRRMPRPLHRFLAIFNATNLLYHFPPLFSAIAVASTRPRLWGTQLNYRQTLSLFGDPETLARTLHFILAAFAIAAVALLWKAQRYLANSQAPGKEAGPTGDRLGSPSNETLLAAQAWIRRGARAALLFSVAQVPAGIVLLFALPSVSRDQLLMGDIWATLSFVTAVAALLALLHTLAAASLGDDSRAVARSAALWLALVMLLMVATRHRTRDEIYRTLIPRHQSSLENQAWRLQS